MLDSESENGPQESQISVHPLVHSFFRPSLNGNGFCFKDRGIHDIYPAKISRNNQK